MAYTADKNTVYFQRLRDLAKALRQARQECEDLRAIYIGTGEINGNGSKDADYQDVDSMTTAEADTFQSIMIDFLAFWDGGNTLADVARGVNWALPFYTAE